MFYQQKIIVLDLHETLMNDEVQVYFASTLGFLFNGEAVRDNGRGTFAFGLVKNNWS